VITLAEWEPVKEHEIGEEKEEDIESDLKETQDEVDEEAN